MERNFDIERYSLQPVGHRGAGSSPAMNRSLLVSLFVAAALIVAGIVSSSTPLTFINLEGLLIVIGGTLVSTFIQFSVLDVRNALAALRQASSSVGIDTPRERVEYLLSLSRRVKEQGILTLEDETIEQDDEFLKLGMGLVVDGHSVDDIKRILQTEMAFSHDLASRSVQVWETMGNFAPAMGLIGTLMGLIQMLGALGDSATVGPAMAMALVATLYGAVSANVFFFPIAGKLRAMAHERQQCKRITLEGLLSISRLENPLMLEQRLQSFASVA
ncbi:MAG: motility protein A [Pseudomonadota bacterium]|jgi:chemotaxis protein MotA